MVPGDTIASRYRIARPLGSGGMGTVYLAEDLTLTRKVALKFLKDAGRPDSRSAARLKREARAASALDHPNIGIVYDIGEWEGCSYIAMAYYPGETLRDRIARGPLTFVEAASIAAQIASALDAAHRSGIVHRDVKPGNVVLTTNGSARLLDFGLARLLSEGDETESRLTAEGSTPGTLAYMAPEQIQGLDADFRADAWAFGVLLYEMLAGRRPFASDNTSDTREAILRGAPQPLGALRPDVPHELSRLVCAALIKDRNARALTMADAARICARYQAQLLNRGRQRAWRRFAAAAVAMVTLILLIAGWRIQRDRRIAWARQTALPQIARLIEEDRNVEAFDLAKEAAQLIPSDPQLIQLRDNTTWTVNVDSVPAGARIAYREYGNDAAPWRPVGTTPIAGLKVPAAFLHWKAGLDGYVTAEDVALTRSDNVKFVLGRPQDIPPRMVRASMGEEPFALLLPAFHAFREPTAVLGDFLIDRYEVTNREFKQFVDAHGYQRPEYWVEPFEDGGRTITRDEAMRLFVDAAGRPGPATWEAGQYRAGHGDDPVTGVSWYEAKAYARFAGKMLPTLFHWSAVAEPVIASLVVPKSNVESTALAPVGGAEAMSRFGTKDMAGNAKEWVENVGAPGTRYIVGGAWNEPAYMFTYADARAPLSRESNFGFRCIKPVDGKSLTAESRAALPPLVRDPAVPTVSDAVFRAYRSHYTYERRPLDARVDSIEDTAADWRLENVSFATAYGHERMTAHLYVPKHVAAPYQTLVEFPGADTINIHEFDPNLEHHSIRRFIVQSGRAIIIPTLKGTYERFGSIKEAIPDTTVNYRDHVVMWMGDVVQSLNYLETRSDIRKDAIGLVGISWGAIEAPIALAIEPRLKTGVLIAGGFYVERALPEADTHTFAPHVSVPVLMINGRFDFLLSPRDSHEPLFRSLGTPPSRKRRVVFDTGHFPHLADIARETLAWLDRYLGPVH